MDGLRRVPDNLPRRELLERLSRQAPTRVPNPFDSGHESFGAHNNAMLCDFLDRFGFDYELVSATAMYTSGRFDEALLTVLERFDAVMRSCCRPWARSGGAPIRPSCRSRR